MRRTVLAAALLPCALALTSCASSTKAGSGTPIVTKSSTAAAPVNAGLTQAELTAKIKVALAAATALHVQGTMTSSGESTTMNIQLNKDGSVQGTVEVEGATMPIIVVNGVTYIQFTSSYIKMLGGAAGTGSAAYMTEMAKYQNKWVSSQSPTGSELAQGAGSGLSFVAMTSQMIDNAQEKYTYLGTGTVDGQQVARYKDVDKQSGTAILSIPLSGPALPILLDAGSQGSMTMVWNQPTTVTAPPASQITTITMPTS